MHGQINIKYNHSLCLRNEYHGDFGAHKHNEYKSAKNVPVLCLLTWKSIVFPLCM